MTSIRMGVVGAVCSLSAVAWACTGGADTTGGSTSSSSGASSSGSTSSGSTSSGSTSSSSGASSSGDPCAGVGCAGQSTTVIVRVLDGSGDPIASPSFTLDGQPVTNPPCVIVPDGGGTQSYPLDAGAACPGYWELPASYMGSPITIVVSAPGFQDQTLIVTPPPRTGCCGPSTTQDRTVTLAST